MSAWAVEKLKAIQHEVTCSGPTVVLEEDFEVCSTKKKAAKKQEKEKKDGLGEEEEEANDEEEGEDKEEEEPNPAKGEGGEGGSVWPSMGHSARVWQEPPGAHGGSRNKRYVASYVASKNVL
jgi:hypothetical protein